MWAAGRGGGAPPHWRGVGSGAGPASCLRRGYERWRLGGGYPLTAGASHRPRTASPPPRRSHDERTPASHCALQVGGVAQ